MQKTDAFPITRFAFDTFPRQSQHPVACVYTIDLNSRMEPQQFREKSPIPLPDDQRTSRSRNFSETGNTTSLERITKSDPLQRPIPGGERVEAHAVMTTNTSSGVSRTRSASAVR